MSQPVPIECLWDGEAFRPISRYMTHRAERQFARGEVLRLVGEPERSNATHNHYFASISNAWESLPPMLAERFPSPEHLRKYALVKAGFCYSDSITCPSHADALRVSAFVRGMDEFAVVTVNKNVVTRFTPKSQSYRSMNKADFAASKEKVLEIIAAMLEVSKAELTSSPTPPEAVGAI